MGILDDELEDLEDDLGSAEDNIGSSPGPLNEPAQSSVADRLTSAQAHISNVLREINQAGTAHTGDLPHALPMIAHECTTLAGDAHKESLESTSDTTVIGNKVKTINHIIDAPNGYRARAGIV